MHASSSTDHLGALDDRVRDRIIAETRGNPLALIELPRALDRREACRRVRVSDASPLQGRIEACFRSQVEELPEDTRRLLLLAAAEPLGDPSLLWRAGAAVGSRPMLRRPPRRPTDRGDGRITFRHPLLRSRSTAPRLPRSGGRRTGRSADATDPELDPDRRAWHRGHAALDPDEDVAAELERSADRARARGGLPAAAAFLERAAD